MKTDKNGVIVGATKPLKVCGTCGPRNLAYAGRIEVVICEECMNEALRAIQKKTFENLG